MERREHERRAAPPDRGRNPWARLQPSSTSPQAPTADGIVRRFWQSASQRALASAHPALASGWRSRSPLAADALQLVLAPLFGEGFLSPLDDALDMGVALGAHRCARVPPALAARAGCGSSGAGDVAVPHMDGRRPHDADRHRRSRARMRPHLALSPLAVDATLPSVAGLDEELVAVLPGLSEFVHHRDLELLGTAVLVAEDRWPSSRASASRCPARQGAAPPSFMIRSRMNCDRTRLLQLGIELGVCLARRSAAVTRALRASESKIRTQRTNLR